MFKLNKLQREFLGSIFRKVLLFPALYFFVLAMLPFSSDLTLYIMKSSFDWILFVLTVFGAVSVEMIMAHPELKSSLTHIDMTPRHKTLGSVSVATEKMKKKKASDSI